MRSIFELLDVDAGPLLDASDPAKEESSRRELGLERGTALGRQRHEQTACRLRVVSERIERLG